MHALAPPSLLIRSSLNRNPLTLKYRKEGKMQAEVHERDILDGLSAGDKSDNAAQQPAK
jgi:hypothetical protein